MSDGAGGTAGNLRAAPQAPPSQTTTLVRGDVILHGTVTGRGDTALLLHAGGENRAVWVPVADALAGFGVRAVAFDLRGHGDSGGRPTSLREVAEDVAAIIRRESSPVAVVGASLGGLAAIAALGDSAAARRVTGLLLVDVVPDLDPGRTRRWLDERRLRDRSEYPAELVDDILQRNPKLVRNVVGWGRPLTLVRGGIQSPLVDDDVARLRRANPRVAVRHLSVAGHLVARDAPLGLAEIIRDCVREWGLWGTVDGDTESIEAEVGTRRAISLLEQLGAGSVAHPGGTLLAHLERVHALTEEWRASRRAQLAALCHAMYGTDGFSHALLPVSDRLVLTELIGPPAERLVYLYGGCDRSVSYRRIGENPLQLRDRFTGEDVQLRDGEQVDFAVLSIANELDVARHAQLPVATLGQIRSLLEGLAMYAPNEAAAALNDPALRGRN